MRKEDWIKAIENTFDDVTEKTKVDDRHIDLTIDRTSIDPDGIATTILIPKNSRIYTIVNDFENIMICTKKIINDHSADSFTGTHIIISKEIETCILADTLSVNRIPWNEISVITIEYHPETT